MMNISISSWLNYVLAIFTLLLAVAASSSKARYIMYLTGQHDIVPEPSLVSDVTHVALAFIRSEVFNQAQPAEWPLFTTVNAVRPKFAKGTAVMVAIGGWANTDGFSEAAKSDESRTLFAKNIKALIDETGADGIDIDWEYPGGNGEDYKTTPNSEKSWEITAYPKLLSKIRTAIGPSKILSAAVPGLPRDMLAFTPSTLPSIATSVDFLNIMTYDLMNRRDNVTKHHTGIQNSLEAIDAYLDGGIPAQQANLGFAFYVKWFKTDADADCRRTKPLGCRTARLEDPDTGADLGRAGAFSWHDQVPLELAGSFERAFENGAYEETEGGHCFWDEEEGVWWSWDTPEAIASKFPRIVQSRGLGGVFAWGLGEDAEAWVHFKAALEGFRKMGGSGVGGGGGGGERSEL